MIFLKTATKANDGKIYAFGRDVEYIKQPTSEGGYILFVQQLVYRAGSNVKIWAAVKENMAHKEAILLMNKRCGYCAFNLPA